MNKLDYITALKNALTGLPSDVIADTLNAYELRFVEGLSAGRSEAEIIKDLDDPKMVAAKLNANTHLTAFQQKKNPRNLWRLFMSLIGLAVFNFFLIVPSIVFLSMLFASFVAAIGIFVGGTVFTAASMSGVNEVVFNEPTKQVNRHDNGSKSVTEGSNKLTVQIDNAGVRVHEEDTSGNTKAGASDKAIEISTDTSESRITQTFQGIGMILGSILLLLLSLVITKYTFIGIKRYAQMNYTMLRNI